MGRDSTSFILNIIIIISDLKTNQCSMATQTHEEESYSDEDDFEEDDLTSGWQLAARGVQLALNNRVEEAHNLLKVDSSCIHRQAGFCYLTFIVRKTRLKILPVLTREPYTMIAYCIILLNPLGGRVYLGLGRARWG
jgi:hypothetical protein